MIQNETRQRVIKQNVGRQSMEDYMAEKVNGN